MRIIEERDARTEHRKEMKRIFDKRFSLSSSDAPSDTFRLLDEGLITYADGSPQMYIKKGVIDKLLENMSDDYEGSINFGHHDLASDPISIIGEWKKSDLFVEDSGNDDGRKVLNVRPHLWDDHIYVQQLKRQPYTYGLSAEFYGELDWDASYDMGIPVIGSIDLLDFAVVGECGNVNSSDIHLRGEDMGKLKDMLKKLHVEEEETPTEETPAEEETPVEEETPAEETPVEESVDTNDADEDEEDVVEMFELMMNQITELKQENENLRSEVNKLNPTIDKIKNLKLSVGNSTPSEKVTSDKRYAGKDGIGEL